MSQQHYRRLATGSNAALVSVLVIAIVVVLVGLADRWAVRWDLSEDRSASLAPETYALLERLDAEEVEIEVTVFTVQRRGGDDWYRNRVLQDLAAELDLASPWLTARFVDFDLELVTANALGVKGYGTIVVQGRDDRVDLVQRELFEQVGPRNETLPIFHGEALVRRTVAQILSDSARTVYVLEGHGERRLADRGTSGIRALGVQLQDLGWTVRGLDLVREAKGSPLLAVPEDASAVLVVGPTAPLTPDEEGALGTYLGGGGRLAFFLEPGGFVPDLVEDLGVTVPSGELRDPASWLPHEDRPLLRYRRHAITEGLIEAGIDLVVAQAAPLSLHEADGARLEVLLETSRKGWIERGDEQPARYDPAVDGAGPATGAVAVRLQAPHPVMSQGTTARVVVVGDVDAVTDELLAEGPGNAAFVQAAVRWLVGAEDASVAIGRRGALRQLVLSPQQISSIRMLVLGFLPITTLFIGLLVWMRRRNR